ncbi:MAG: esterase/lipase family protein [Bacillota bacterium]|uniref:esterase/lipase family protein n=1 Tax=Rossellomorea sp. FM04394 TaxID=3243076 RepID=UPI0035A5866C
MHEKMDGMKNSSGIPGRWFVDEMAEGSEGYPILFIHGIHASSDTWIRENDLQEFTRKYGHQAAFIDLYPDEDMWKNGQLLGEKLREIYGYFKRKVVVVGHSKGGIDVQTALVHYGAGPYVERVITLSSPHHGSELADLAYSKWAGWLTDALKSKNNAVFSLQTGYMKSFRSETDELELAKAIPFYTFGGTGWGGVNSELFWGGLYLSRYGQSDGAVLVTSSRLPYGKEVRVQDWSHTTIKEGGEIFPYLKDLLTENLQEISYAAVSELAKDEETSVLHRGGVFMGVGVEKFSVEEEVEKISVDWISDQQGSSYELISPNGQVYKQFMITEDATGFFPGAYHHSIIISKPLLGRWEMRAHNSHSEKYMLTILFQKGVSKKGDQFASDGEPLMGSWIIHDKPVKKTYTIQHIPTKSGNKKTTTLITTENLSSLPLAEFEEGVHNITIDIEGETQVGNQFQRTIIQTVYVDGNGNIY